MIWTDGGGFFEQCNWSQILVFCLRWSKLSGSQWKHLTRDTEEFSQSTWKKSCTDSWWARIHYKTDHDVSVKSCSFARIHYSLSINLRIISRSNVMCSGVRKATVVFSSRSERNLARGQDIGLLPNRYRFDYGSLYWQAAWVFDLFLQTFFALPWGKLFQNWDLIYIL